MRLCGISSRFRLLSPCVRQVAHALLTRPPLSQINFHTEIIRFICFVRLACVRHAASVHPEPGSNSLIKFISSQNLLTFFTVLRSLPLLVIRNVFSKILIESFKVISLFSYQCALLSLARQLLKYIRCFSACQQLFYIFLRFFSDNLLLSLKICRRFPDGESYNIMSREKCQQLF